MAWDLVGDISSGTSKLFENLGLSGKGPSTMGPQHIDTGAFKDPYLEQNKKLLEAQRQAQIGQAGQAYGTQAGLGAQQQALINQLQLQATGQGGPSLAELQMQRGQDQLRQALASQAASQGGVSAGLGARNLARQQAGIGQDLLSQTGMLRAQEQQQAQQNLGALLGQTRGQEQQMAQMGQNLALQYMQLGMSADQAQFLANQKLEEMKQGARQAQAQTGIQQQAGIIGGLAGGAAAYMTGGGSKAGG